MAIKKKPQRKKPRNVTKPAFIKNFFGAKKRVPKKIKEIDEFLNSENGETYRRLMAAIIQRYQPEKAFPPRPNGEPSKVEIVLDMIKKSKSKKGSRACVSYIKKENSAAFRNEVFRTGTFTYLFHGIWEKNGYELASIEKISPTYTILYDLFLLWFTEATTLEANEKNIECYLHYKNSGSLLRSIIIPAVLAIASIVAFKKMKDEFMETKEPQPVKNKK